jgi:hypothetical protein
MLVLLTACGGDSAGSQPTEVAIAASPTAAVPATMTSTPTASSTPVNWEPKAGLALLEPENGAYFGVNLDWERDSATAFNDRLGEDAAAYVQFAPFPFDDGWRENLRLYFEQVQAAHGLAVLTLEPTIPLDEITAAQADDLALLLKEWNDNGVGVLLRFAHEMNGSWYGWGQQPEAYVAAFRLIAESVHATAPGTALLWAPNYGAGYPFVSGAHRATVDAPDFALLDTNHNGALDDRDDPYAPYYPGDDAVDWVGLSLYHWGSAYPWGENEMPEDGKFVAQLTGNYSGANGDETVTPDFYADYAEQRDKPLAIVETAALYNTTEAGASALALKQAWWQQVFAPEVFERFPRLRMINWFEWDKAESEIGGDRIDWTVTQDPDILAAFVADLPRDRLRFAPVGE